MGIHGEIDGCRREVLWLKISTPKKDPAAISKYFLDFVSQTYGSARVVELVGAPKIVLLLICRGILILEGTKITVGYCRFSYAETWELLNLFVGTKNYNYHICCKNLAKYSRVKIHG